MNTSARIGTPLSSTATCVMVRGAGEPAKEVVIALQPLGAETITVGRVRTARLRARDAVALVRPGVP